MVPGTGVAQHHEGAGLFVVGGGALRAPWPQLPGQPGRGRPGGGSGRCGAPWGVGLWVLVAISSSLMYSKRPRSSASVSRIVPRNTRSHRRRPSGAARRARGRGVGMVVQLIHDQPHLPAARRNLRSPGRRPLVSWGPADLGYFGSSGWWSPRRSHGGRAHAGGNWWPRCSGRGGERRRGGGAVQREVASTRDGGGGRMAQPPHPAPRGTESRTSPPSRRSPTPAGSNVGTSRCTAPPPRRRSPGRSN